MLLANLWEWAIASHSKGTRPCMEVANIDIDHHFVCSLNFKIINSNYDKMIKDITKYIQLMPKFNVIGLMAKWFQAEINIFT